MSPNIYHPGIICKLSINDGRKDGHTKKKPLQLNITSVSIQ